MSSARFVRQFALTGGRTVPFDGFALETMVLATTDSASLQPLPAEQSAIVELAHIPLSVAEIAAHRRLHLGVARVLVADLVEAAYLVVASERVDQNGPDPLMLQRLIDGIRQL
jgi:Protein of unknown function (DUF742)